MIKHHIIILISGLLIIEGCKIKTPLKPLNINEFNKESISNNLITENASALGILNIQSNELPQSFNAVIIGLTKDKLIAISRKSDFKKNCSQECHLVTDKSAIIYEVKDAIATKNSISELFTVFYLERQFVNEQMIPIPISRNEVTNHISVLTIKKENNQLVTLNKNEINQSNFYSNIYFQPQTFIYQKIEQKFYLTAFTLQSTDIFTEDDQYDRLITYPIVFMSELYSYFSTSLQEQLNLVSPTSSIIQDLCPKIEDMSFNQVSIEDEIMYQLSWKFTSSTEALTIKINGKPIQPDIENTYRIYNPNLNPFPNGVYIQSSSTNNTKEESCLCTLKPISCQY